MTRLLHLSDTHLHAPGFATLHPEIDTRARLERAIGHVREHAPFDAVVITGDVCDDGSEEAAHRVRAMVDGLAPVILAVPGNHDFSAPVRTAFGTPRADVGDWLVIGIETQVEGHVEGVADQIVPALAEAGEHPAVLLMHHPIQSRSTHEWFTLRGGEAAARAVASHTAPLVILSGHTHEAYASTLGSAHLLGAPSTYYTIRHRGDEFDFVPAQFGAAMVTLDEPGRAPSVDLIMLSEGA